MAASGKGDWRVALRLLDTLRACEAGQSRNADQYQYQSRDGRPATGIQPLSGHGRGRGAGGGGRGAAGMVGGGRVAAAMVQVKRVQERKVALVMAAAETVVAVTAEE